VYNPALVGKSRTSSLTRRANQTRTTMMARRTRMTF